MFGGEAKYLKIKCVKLWSKQLEIKTLGTLYWLFPLLMDTFISRGIKIGPEWK